MDKFEELTLNEEMLMQEVLTLNFKKASNTKLIDFFNVTTRKVQNELKNLEVQHNNDKQGFKKIDAKYNQKMKGFNDASTQVVTFKSNLALKIQEDHQKIDKLKVKNEERSQSFGSTCEATSQKIQNFEESKELLMQKESEVNELNMPELLHKQELIMTEQQDKTAVFESKVKELEEIKDTLHVIDDAINADHTKVDELKIIKDQKIYTTKTIHMNCQNNYNIFLNLIRENLEENIKVAQDKNFSDAVVLRDLLGDLGVIVENKQEKENWIKSREEEIRNLDKEIEEANIRKTNLNSKLDKLCVELNEAHSAFGTMKADNAAIKLNHQKKIFDMQQNYAQMIRKEKITLENFQELMNLVKKFNDPIDNDVKSSDSDPNDSILEKSFEISSRSLKNLQSNIELQETVNVAADADNETSIENIPRDAKRANRKRKNMKSKN